MNKYAYLCVASTLFIFASLLVHGYLANAGIGSIYATLTLDYVSGLILYGGFLALIPSSDQIRHALGEYTDYYCYNSVSTTTQQYELARRGDPSKADVIHGRETLLDENRSYVDVDDVVLLTHHDSPA